MKILAIILARGGSKRLPGKNIRLLGSRPLIAWTLVAAKESGVVDDVLVSTDDAEIAKIAIQWGGNVPWLRPAELARDTSPSMDAILHALVWYEQAHGTVDGVMLLQPTSPFRSPETIRRAVELFRTSEMRPIVSVSLSEAPPEWCFRIKENSMVPVLGWEAIGQRSQDLEPAFVLNGVIYIGTPAFLKKNRTFLTRETCPLLIDDMNETLDIDTEWDWQVAEDIVKKKFD